MITPSNRKTAGWFGSKPASTNRASQSSFSKSAATNVMPVDSIRALRSSCRLVDCVCGISTSKQRICPGRGRRNARVEACAKEDELVDGGEVALDGGIDERHAGGGFELRRDVAFEGISEGARHI